MTGESQVKKQGPVGQSQSRRVRTYGPEEGAAVSCLKRGGDTPTPSVPSTNASWDVLGKVLQFALANNSHNLSWSPEQSRAMASNYLANLKIGERRRKLVRVLVEIMNTPIETVRVLLSLGKGETQIDMYT